jgi:hypothetical protein
MEYTLRITGFLDSYPSFGILNTRKHNVSETGSVPVLRRGEGDTGIYLLCLVP